MGVFLHMGLSGAVLGLGPVSLAPYVLAAAIPTIMLICRRTAARTAAFDLLSGAGVALLASRGCNATVLAPPVAAPRRAPVATNILTRIPWLIGGLVLLVAGVLAHRTRARRESRPDASPQGGGAIAGMERAGTNEVAEPSRAAIAGAAMGHH